MMQRKVSGDFVVLDTEVAKAYIAALSAATTAGEAWDTVDATSQHGYVKSIQLKRQSIHFVTSKWRELCETVAGGGVQNDAFHASEIGTSITFTAPVNNSEGKVVVVSVTGIPSTLRMPLTWRWKVLMTEFRSRSRCHSRECVVSCS